MSYLWGNASSWVTAPALPTRARQTGTPSAKLHPQKEGATPIYIEHNGWRGTRERCKYSNTSQEGQLNLLFEKCITIVCILKTLESVQRRRFIFEHRSHDQPGPTPQSHDSRDLCPVCSIQLPSDDDSRVAHIDDCLRDQQHSLAEEGEREGTASSDSEDETYEEYTWCNTTRIRTTSLLSPQTRASKEIIQL